MGPSEIEKRAIVLCKLQNQQIITETSIQSVLQHLNVGDQNRQFLDIFQNLRNEYYDKMSRKLTQSKINPIFQMVLNNRNKFEYDEIFKSKNFFKIFYGSVNKNIRTELNSHPSILETEKLFVNEIAKLRAKLTSDYFHENLSMINDVKGKNKQYHQYTQKSEKMYFTLLKNLNEFFALFEKQIEKIHTDLVQDVMFEFHKDIEGKVNPKLMRIFWSSELNKNVGFLTADHLIHIDKIVDFLLLSGKIDSVPENTSPVYLNIYDWEKYSDKKKVVLI